MTDEEIREAIAGLTNMPVEIEEIIRKVIALSSRSICPNGYDLVRFENCDLGENNECLFCWLGALRHD